MSKDRIHYLKHSYYDPRPDNRSATYGKPIVIEDKRWIGYGAIVGANSVVTCDVPPVTVVAKNSARFIKKIETK